MTINGRSHDNTISFCYDIPVKIIKSILINTFSFKSTLKTAQTTTLKVKISDVDYFQVIGQSFSKSFNHSAKIRVPVRTIRYQDDIIIF